MRNSKLGRVLGLAIVASLSILAFTAVSAQAGVFKIAGGAALLAEVVGTQESLGTLLVPGRNLTLICHAGKVLEKSHIISGTEGLGKVQFESCLPFSHTKGTALPCTVHNPEATAVLNPALHPANTPYVIAKPDPPSTNFVSVIMLGESCPLPEVNPVKGEVAAQVTTNNTAKNLISFKPGMLSTLLTNPLSFGGSAATIEGTAWLELAGTHKGLTFGIG